MQKKNAEKECRARDCGWQFFADSLLVAWGICPSRIHDIDFVYGKIKEVSLQRWQRHMRKHRSYIPYHSFSSVPGGAFRLLTINTTAWPVLKACISWAKLRCGTLRITQKDGADSHATVQHCHACNQPVFCNGGLSSGRGVHHVLADCVVFKDRREALQRKRNIVHLTNVPLVMNIIGCEPGQPGFEEAAFLAQDVDLSCARFWKSYKIAY